MKTKDFLVKNALLGLTIIGCLVFGFLIFKTKDVNYLCALSVWVTLLAVIDCIINTQKEKKEPSECKKRSTCLRFCRQPETRHKR